MLFIIIISAGCSELSHLPDCPKWPQSPFQSEKPSHQSENQIATIPSETQKCSNIQLKKLENESEQREFWKRLNDCYADSPNRRLVVFIDGTGQTGEDKTNIWRLYQNAVRTAQSQPVIPYYQKGVGTTFGNFIRGKIYGSGIKAHIKKAYHFLVAVYQPGDEVFLFGFSRGAYTARSLNGMIDFVGLLDKNSPTLQGVSNKETKITHLIDELYNFYHQKNDAYPQFENRLRCDIKNKIRDNITNVSFYTGENKVIVTAIGVFDTVSALGVSHDDYPDNHRVSLYAKRGYHALSLDEQRNYFRPLRFDGNIRKDQILEEVWFAGDHSDIGGGHGEDKGLEGVSRQWMLQKFAPFGLFSSESGIICGQNKNEGQCEEGPLHDGFLDASGWFTQTIYRSAGLHWRKPHYGDTLHASVICRLNIKALPKPHQMREQDKLYRPQNLYFSDENEDHEIYKLRPDFYQIEPYLPACRVGNTAYYGCSCESN